MSKQNTTIFIVDDLQENAIVLVNIFEPLGYKTMVALDGKTAIRLINDYKPDLVLLDIMMPQMDGYEVCAALKENPKTKDIPVIFLSALSDTANKVKGLEIGGVDYISKPFEEAEVISRVKVHIENSRLQKELKDTNDKKNRFFSIIAHDLRAPLGKIMTSTRLLEDFTKAKDFSSIQEAAKSLHEVSKGTMDLIRNLLEWSRIQIGALKINLQKQNIDAIVVRVLDSFSKEISHKNLEITNNIPKDSFVIADRHILQTVFENLLSNAIKFSLYAGQIELYEEKEDTSTCISIKDNGIGIPEETIEKILKIDENVQTDGTGGEKGTGLGLILCKDMLELNSGSLQIKQSVPKGTIVSFSLPIEENFSKK
ncbi:MAG: hybrid sensor histidine kinase/response regulator [Spirochaetota bacterium]